MKCRFFALLWLLVGLTAVRGQEFRGETLVEASLVADTTAVVPGQAFRVGLLLKMAPKWHTYWQYSGDAGLPTTIEWQLPDGFGAGPIEWPLPKGYVEPGDIQVYAYGDEVMLLTTIQPPEDLKGESVTISGRADWLVCADLCIPGTAELSLELPVASGATSANRELFERWEGKLPRADAPPFRIEWSRDGGDLVAQVRPGSGVTEMGFFPLPTENQEVGHAVVSEADGEFSIRIAATGDLPGVLVTAGPSGREGWFVSQGGAVEGDGMAIWQALLLGILGGLILNLMPCVLPVISLKIFGFIQQAGEAPGKILAHGMAFAAGIFAWFLGLGLVVVGLKAGGSEVNWAFQFQNPVFLLVVSAVVFVFALNLLGVFEVVLPGRAAGGLAAAGSRDGLGGTFFQGMFATLLATPCTGPFLGTALGFAFAQSAPVILAMFAAVALGMALPYLLLAARPGWMRFLPKPGAWMERLKQFMAFPLFATLLWLLFVIGQQNDVGMVIWIGSFLLCLALACWIYGAFCGPGGRGRSRLVALAAVVLVAGGGGWWSLGQAFAGEEPEFWQPFTQARVDELRAEGRPVFIDFTADWCLICQYNERTVLALPRVREAFAAGGIVPIKADWTSADPEITAALKEFGRVGVPFYLFYPADGGEPVTFPELLTENIVLEAFRGADRVPDGDGL